MTDLLPKEFENGFIVKSAKEPRLDREGNVSMRVLFGNLEDLGELPFLAMERDAEAHGRWLHTEALAGAFGPVAPYERPLPTVEDLRAEFDKVWPDVTLGLADQETIDLARNLRIQIKAMTE